MSSLDDSTPRVPDPRMVPVWHRPSDDGPPRRPHAEASPVSEPASDDEVVRPFLLTGGRTRPLRDGLRLETQLRAAPAALSAPLRFELRRIVELCQSPRSLADVASGLRLPVGVARVLVADLAADDYLTVVSVQEPAELPIALIERIADRVRAL